MPGPGPDERQATATWASSANSVAGLWLVAAPFVLGYRDVAPALANDVVVGLAVLALGWLRAARPLWYRPLSWVNAAIGGWLLLAPFVLGYVDVPLAVGNDLTIGVVVVLLGGVSAMATRQLQRRR